VSELYNDNAIESFIGKEFEYRATGPDKFDCWTLTEFFLRKNGITIPTQDSIVDVTLRHLKIVQVEQEHFIKLEKPEKYAIVLFKLKPPMVTHMGVVIDDGIHFLHIMSKRRSCIERLDNILWSRKIEGFYRYAGTGNTGQ